jgi:hypothetical protein
MKRSIGLLISKFQKIRTENLTFSEFRSNLKKYLSEDFIASLKERLKALQSAELDSLALIRKQKSEIAGLQQVLKSSNAKQLHITGDSQKTLPLELQVKKLSKVISKTEKALKLLLNIDEDGVSLLKMLSTETLLCLNECYLHGQRNIKKLLNLRKIEQVMEQDGQNSVSEFSGPLNSHRSHKTKKSMGIGMFE